MSFEEWDKQNKAGIAVAPINGFEAWDAENKKQSTILSDRKSTQFKEFALTKEGSSMVAASAPEIAAKIAAKETPSRNDFKELDISGWSAKERNQLASLFRDDLATPRAFRGAGAGMTFPYTPKPFKDKSLYERIGFGESVREEFTRQPRGAQYVPILGGVIGAAQNLRYLAAADRLQKGFDYTQPTQPEEMMPGAAGLRPARYTNREEDQKVLDDLWIRLEKQQQGYTFWGKVAKGVLQLPTWMAEFALTGGLANLGSKAAKEAGVKLMGRWAKTKAGQLALKSAGWTGGAITRATLGLTPRILEKGLERRVQVQILGTEQEGWATSFVKAWGDITIEAASETAGAAITGVPMKLLRKSKLGNAFFNSLQKGWMKATGGSAGAFARKMATKGGYSNFIGEMGEEWLGTILRAITDVEDFGAGKDAGMIERLTAGLKEHGKNVGVEAVVLSIPMAGQVALGRAAIGIAGRELAPKPAAEVTPQKRNQAIDYVKSILSQEQYAALDEKAKIEIGQRMLAEQGLEVEAEELAVTAPTVPIPEPTEAMAAKRPAEVAEIPPEAAEAKPEAVEAEKEIEYEEEAITEPTPSPEVEPREARKFVPTGKLDPTNAKEALEITRRHAQWIDRGGDVAVGGIFEQKWDAGKQVVSSVEYTSKQVDTAYRTVQKPVESPMPDTELFAMPGKEAQMKAIAQKMEKVKGVVRPKKIGRKGLTKPTALPKAKIKKEDHIKAVYVAATKEKEPAERYHAINGIKVEGDIIVATDGRRMFWAKGKWGKDGLYLDAVSLKKGSLGKPTKEKINFPQWRDIIPDVSDQKPILVDLEAALSHVRQAVILTSEESRGITVIENKDERLGLGFAAAAPEVGHAEINIEPGGRILGAVNPQYLLDAIKFHAIRGDTVIEFYFKNFDRPVLTRSLDGKTNTLTMPINVGEPSEAITKAISEGKPPITARAEPAAKPKSKGKPEVEVKKKHKKKGRKEKPAKTEEKAKGEAVEPLDTELQIQENAVAQIPKSPKRGTIDRTVLDSLNKPITPEEKGILSGMGMTIPEILKGEPAELRKKIAVSKNARRRMGGFFNIPIETPDPVKVRTFFETLYQNIVNRFASIENITKKAKKLGMDIPPGLDPTKRARLYLGFGRKVESILRDKTFRIDRKGNIVITGEGLKPILDSYDLNMTKYERKRKQRQKDFNQYLFAQRTILDLQRPAYEGAPRLIVTPKQVAQAKEDLAALNKKLGAKAIAEMESHAQRLYAFQKRILHSLVDGGNMSQKLYDKIVKENPHYIPFDRVLNKDTFAGVPVTKNRFTKARAGIRKIKGTELEIEKQEPIESVIKNTHRIIEAAERNLVTRSIARLSKVLPGDVKPVRIKMFPIRVDPAEILTVVKEFRSKSAKITDEFKKTRTEGGESADVSGPIKKLEVVVKEALTSRGFSEGEANSFIAQIRKGKPTTEGGESTHTVETIRQVIRETQKIITTEIPIESTIFRPSQFAPKGNVIEYYVNGKRRYMEVSPNLYAAMTGLTEEGASIVADILSVPAHWLRVGATITPEFMARNPIRDTYTALMQTSYGFIPFYDSIGAIADIVGKTEVYQDWIRSGAAHSGFVELSRPALKKAYKGLQTTRGKQILSKLNIISDAQDISQILEEATRVAVFKRATRRGLSDVEAGYEAREATVDFARRGAKMGNINKTIAFFNAGIQGFDKTIRNSITHPYSTAIKGVIFITLPSLLLYLRNRDDDEYKELAQWKKDLFWNCKLNDIWFRFPKPFLYGQVFGSMPERFFEYLDTKDINALDGLVTSMIKSSSPIGLNPIETMIPTGIKPFVENFFNYNLFRERTLVPEHLISGPKPDQFTRYTSETAKQFGEWLNMSPAKIENTIYGLTGGTGGHVLGGTDALINAIKGESSPRRPKGLADIPLVKGFVSRDPSGPSAQSIADFYIETKRITGLRTSWMGKRKKGDDKAADKMLERNPELTLGPTLVKHQTALSKLSKGIDSIAQGDLSTEEKREKIKELDQRRVDLARQANDLIKEKMRKK